ncbi:MAG: hypothetical protein J6O41_03470 [Clostridia bacterium]|nr:hypothetical protein [Clostridia bacterium]
MSKKKLPTNELLELINNQWATVEDIRLIGSVGYNKALEIKNDIILELGENYFLPRGLVPMDKVVDYFNININYLKKVSK